MRAGTVQLETPDGTMPLYEARPDGEARGAVVVVQEAFGVNEHIEEVTRRFAAAGYHGAAPHLFHRKGGGTLPYDDLSEVREKMADLDDAAVLRDVDAALGHLRVAGWEDARIGVVGFCMGGRIAFLVALRRALGAAVCFYGGGIVTPTHALWPPLVGEAASLRTPWLGLFGDRDPIIPVEDVERLRAALATAPVPAEVVRYADAGHGFFCDARPAYRPASAEDAWRRTLAWLERHIG